MPANVSHEYSNAQQKYDSAATLQEKLLALQEMKSFAPAHKGGENLRKEISKKIAKLKNELEKQKAVTSKKGGGQTFSVKKDGAGQIVIVGLPNSGKSTLLNTLTGTTAQVASYPFTTKTPQVGMMDYEGAKVQLVELPAIIAGSSQGKALGNQLLSLVRNADGILITFENEQDKQVLLKELGQADILINQEKPRIEIKLSGFKGITISGRNFLKMKESELTSFLKNFGYSNASIVFQEDATREKVAQVLNHRLVYKKAVLLNPKKEFNEAELKEKIFFLTGKILVYTKKPGEDADLKDPLVIENGSTVEEFATRVHKDFAKNLKSAKVWGSTKFGGQMIPKNYKLQNKDIIELS